MKVFELVEDQPTPPDSLGWAAGLLWYRDADAPEGSREPTAEELAKANLELPAIRQLKASTRRRIEAEMGCVYDIVADQAKQIEALTVLVARLSADYLGGTAMDAVTKATYLARVEHIVSSLDSGSLTLRGGAEDTDDMLNRVLYRASRINEIVETEYLPRRAGVMS